MLAYKGLENYSRVAAEKEMALSASCAWRIGHIRDPRRERGAEGRGRKARKLVWN